MDFKVFFFMIASYMMLVAIVVAGIGATTTGDPVFVVTGILAIVAAIVVAKRYSDNSDNKPRLF